MYGTRACHGASMSIMSFGKSALSTSGTSSTSTGRGGGAGRMIECSLCLETLDRAAAVSIQLGGVPGGRNQNQERGEPSGGTARNGGGGNYGGSGGGRGGYGWKGRGGGRGTEWRNGSSDGAWNGRGGRRDGDWGNRTVWGEYSRRYNGGGRGGRSKDGGSYTRIYGGSGGDSIGRWGSSSTSNGGQRTGTGTAIGSIAPTTNPTVVVATHCGHLYHQVCLEKCFREKGRRNCPTCRKMLSTSEVFRLYPRFSENPCGAIRPSANPGGGGAIIRPSANPGGTVRPSANPGVTIIRPSVIKAADNDPGPPIVGNSRSATWGSPFTSAGALNLNPVNFGGYLGLGGGYDYDRGCGFQGVLNFSLLRSRNIELWQRTNYLLESRDRARGTDPGAGPWRREYSSAM